MRRSLTTFVLTLSVLVLSALPALATENGQGIKSEGSEINGVLFALLLGVIVGTGLFLHASAGDTGHREHHGDEAGH